MATYYILNNAPTVEAATAREAAKSYALANKIIGGTITLAVNVKLCSVADIPKDIQVTDV